MAKNQAKAKQHQHNFCYLKIICSPHPRFHPKIIGDILKMYKKTSSLFKRDYMINDNKNEAKNEK